MTKPHDKAIKTNGRYFFPDHEWYQNFDTFKHLVFKIRSNDLRYR